jgi:hypothetical protein
MSVGILGIKCTLINVQPRPVGQIQLHVQDGPLDAYGDCGGIGWIGGEASVYERIHKIIAKLLNTEDLERGGHHQVPFVMDAVVCCSGARQFGAGQGFVPASRSASARSDLGWLGRSWPLTS